MQGIICVFIIYVSVAVHSCTFEVSKWGKICDGGEETWTVGYGNRSLLAVVKHRNCSVSRLKEDFIWCEVKELCPSVAYIGDGNVIRYNASAYWMQTNNTHLVTALDFYDVVEDSDKKKVFGVRRISEIEPWYVWNISIKYCPKEKNRNGVAILGPRSNYTYGDIGYFSCPKGYYLVDTVAKQLAADNTSTICGTCARWNRTENMNCWRAPNVTLNPSAINTSFTVGDQLTTDICNVLDYGKPNALIALFQNNLELLTPLTLRPEHNNRTVYCNAQNELTQILDDGGTFSEPFILMVEFGPSAYSEWTSCTANDFELGLYNFTLNMSLSANPPVELNVFGVNGMKQNAILKSSNGSVGCCGVRVQNFEITLINVTTQNRVTVVFYYKNSLALTRFYAPITSNCSTIQVTTEVTPTTPSITTVAGPDLTQTATTTDKPIESAKLSETTIAIICSAVVIVLVLIAGFLTIGLHFRKRSAAGQDSSSRQDHPSIIPMTVNPAPTDSPQIEDKGPEAAYEIPSVNEYETIQQGKIGPAYQNVRDASNSGFNEDTAYAL